MSEALATLRAGEGSLAHVYVPLVGPQVATACKPLAALSAPKWPLPCVCACVHGELRRGEEALVAELAGVQTDAGVAQQVAALVRGVGEALGAVRAGVRSPAPAARSRRMAEGVRVPQSV